MSPIVHEWLNLVMRWTHVIAAIMWVGDSFLFMWMDSHLRKPSQQRLASGTSDGGEVVGELWLAHSGGFYEVVKRKSLDALPPELHWFKWESYFTWITGFLLIIVVYYLGGKAMLVDLGSPLSHLAAVHLSLGLLFATVGVYDLLCRTPLVKNNKVFGVVGFVLVTAVAFGLSQVFSPRALFLQVGAMLGTLMASNVFLRIIPAQKHMLAATKAGTPVDTSYGMRAKQRSTHNHYLTLPVLFTMLSNHFPSLYGHSQPWAVLALLFLFGAGLKYTMNFRRQTPPLILGGSLAALIGVLVLTAPVSAKVDPQLAAQPKVSFATAQSIVQSRCVTCHSPKPTNPAFAAPPSGIVLDTPEQLAALADRVLVRAVTTKTMPLGNLTAMTDGERLLLGAWVVQGADVHAPGPVDLTAALQAGLPTVFATPALEARSLFDTRCAACHGALGHGDGPAAVSLTPKPRNYTDAAWQGATTDANITKAILEGGAAIGKSAAMPGNPDLDGKPEVVAELVKIIRSLGAKP